MPELNPVTQAMRPPPRLTDEERDRARDLRCNYHLSFGEIARRLKKPKEAVCRALMTLRMPNEGRTRINMNVDPDDATEFFRRYRAAGETVREAFHRFLVEHPAT